MKKHLLKLPLYLLLSGIVSRIIMRLIISVIMAGKNEWTIEMGNILFWVQLLFSAILFVFIGIKLSRVYTKKKCFYAASIVVVYSFLALLLEQLFQMNGTYSIISYYMYIPLEIFTVITSVALKITEFSGWGAALPSVIAPYLFLLFMKQTVNSGK